MSTKRSNEYHEAKDREIRIARLKKALPHLEFTETGLKNLCSRFKISMEELDSVLKNIQQSKHKSSIHGR